MIGTNWLVSETGNRGQVTLDPPALAASLTGIRGFHTVGCKSVPEFAGTLGELPVDRYDRPYQSGICFRERTVLPRE
jgi:hypothetical protein